MKKKVFVTAIFLVLTFLMIRDNFDGLKEQENADEYNRYKEISSTIQKGEALFDIFKKYNLNLSEFFKIKEASANIHRLKEVYPGQLYKIIVDDNNQISSFIYWIDDDSILDITKNESGFYAEKKAVEYEKRTMHLGGLIKDNLISSMGEGSDNIKLALQLSDIFAWDIDFTTDIRNGDVFKVVVQGLYLNGKFRKYGDIFSAEFINDGVTYRAYRFECNGKADYYGENGTTLRKAFLKAPLNFRRISSRFSYGRFHPILKIYRPHHGLDYSAPAGTPVSTVGDGTINFAGYKGQYGKLVVIRHSNGWKTYYGHLSRINRKIKRGLKVEQGQVIGYVGATGLATGPHLHYEMRANNKPVNPLKIKVSGGSSVPGNLKADWLKYKNEMDSKLVSITPPVFAFDRGTKHGNL